MKLVCIGDSITAGQYVDPAVRWTSVLQQRLGHGCEVVNRGVANDTTRLALERFPRDVQREEPDVVLIQFGANDCNRWKTDRGLPRVSADAYLANLEEMATRAQHFGAEHVYVLTICPTMKGESFEQRAAHYSRLARLVRGAETIDVRSYDWDEDDFLADGIHLSPAGHERYATIVYDHIREALTLDEAAGIEASA